MRHADAGQHHGATAAHCDRGAPCNGGNQPFAWTATVGCIGLFGVCAVRLGRVDTLHAAAPEGSYAICRAGENYVELLTDFVGSRVLWYYFDDDLLLASSSQRALTCLLGSLEVNRAAAEVSASSNARNRARPDARKVHSLKQPGAFPGGDTHGHIIPRTALAQREEKFAGTGFD